MLTVSLRGCKGGDFTTLTFFMIMNGINIVTDATANNLNADPRVVAAATIAAEWWAEKSTMDHKELFTQKLKALIIRVLSALPDDNEIVVMCDYDPKDILAEAVLETYPDLPRTQMQKLGWGLFPTKHETYISRTTVAFKGGYGKPLTEVQIPE